MKFLLLLLLSFTFFSCQNDIREADKTAVEPIEFDRATAQSKAAATEKSIAPAARPNPYNTPPVKDDSDLDSVEGPDVSDDCADAVMDIVSSSPRVKEIMQEIEADGTEATLLMGETPKNNDKGEYDVRIGVDGDLRFETVATVTFSTKTNELKEVDWLTGEPKVIDYDKILLKALGSDCY